MPTLQIHLASIRPGRKGPVFADWIAKHAAEHGGFDVQVIDYAEVALPLHDEPHPPITGKYLNPHTIAWSETVSAADAILFVMPEYNRGYCASVKNAIDYLVGEWQHKPVSFLSYGMAAAGVLAVEQLKQVCLGLGMLVARSSMHVSLQRSLDENDELIVDDGLAGAATNVLNELSALTDASASLRRVQG